MGISVFLPHVSFLSIPFFLSCNGAARAGFDGVEIHLSGRTTMSALRCYRRATSLGLGVTLHEAWSYEHALCGSRHIHNTVFHALGLLPSAGEPIQIQLPRDVTAPIVVYAERIIEILRTQNLRQDCWFQTACHLSMNGKPIVPFDEFVATVEARHIPIVFDVQHYLEYYHGIDGVGGLMRDSRKLGKILEEGWQRLGRFVQEIHLTDCDPALGNEYGRNRYFETGILPIRAFCRMVASTKWNGIVVPEIHPFALRRYGPTKVLEDIHELFM